mgnify:CR=1 FL=1
MRAWSPRAACGFGVRRPSASRLSARKGKSLDLAYDIALELHPDKEDLMHKGVGWLLREAGKTDAGRLERYLRQHGPVIPRTTLRYAIERMPPAKRQEMLRVTKTRK